MPAVKKVHKTASRKTHAWVAPPTKHTGTEGVFHGKQTRTGNSLALRFDRALFKSHPEFSGEVEARVIGPGRMLIVATKQSMSKEDPVLASFMSFLAADMQKHPARIQPLDSGLVERISELTAGMTLDSNEPLGDEELL